MRANSNRVMLLASGFFLVVWTFLHAFVIHQLGFSWSMAFADSVVNNVTLLFCSYVIVMMLKWYQPGKKNWLLFIWIAALAKISTFFTGYALSYLYKDNPEYLLFVDRAVWVRVAVAFLIISGVALEMWIYNIYLAKQADAVKQKEASELLKEAELAGLRQQLQPHFLFNSLNSISALAGSRPEEARKMIQQLSDFLRGTMKKDGQTLVSLKEELNHLQLYLDIEKVRFGHRLHTEIHCKEEDLALRLPPLLLQPIVENAIKFGLYDTIGDIVVRVEVSSGNNYLVINITNPYDPETAKPKEGTGFGLTSVKRRLYLMYSRNDLLQANGQANQFTTTVKIPQTI